MNPNNKNPDAHCRLARESRAEHREKLILWQWRATKPYFWSGGIADAEKLARYHLDLLGGMAGIW